MTQNIRTRITHQKIKSIQPGQTIWDSDIPGFGIRRHKKSLTYFLKYRFGRRQRWFTIGRHGLPWAPEQARREALKLLGTIASGVDPAKKIEDARESMTIAELAWKFLEEHVDAKRKPKTAADYRALLERVIVPKIGSMRVPEVERLDIYAIHAKMRVTPYQANRALAVMSKMFNLAETWGCRPPASNPCRGIEKYPEKARKRNFTKEMYVALGSALDEAEVSNCKIEGMNRELDAFRHRPLKPGEKEMVDVLKKRIRSCGYVPSVAAISAIRLLAITGARKSEILKLKWMWVDLETGVILLPDSKTGAKTIYIDGGVQQVLESLLAYRLLNNPYVIPGGKEGQHLVNLKKPWQAIVSKAGLEDVRIHDLRHGMAQMAVDGGHSLPAIGGVLGHSEVATTSRYARSSHELTKAVAMQTGKAIGELMRSGAS